MKRLWLLLLLVGCDDSPAQNKIRLNEAHIDNVGRVSIESLGEFKDTTAYGMTRRVYLIKDSVSEREFIGITGVGVAEVGSHSDGEDLVTDER